MIPTKKSIFFIICSVYIIVAILIFIMFNFVIKVFSEAMAITGAVMILFSCIVILCVDDFFYDCGRSIKEFFTRVGRLKESRSYQKNMNEVYRLTKGFSNMWYLVLLFTSVIVFSVSLSIFISSLK